MPRKPSSIFLITENPNTTTQQLQPGGMPGALMPPTGMQCWRLPLTDDTTPEQLIEQHLQAQPLGTVMYWVEDTKVTACRVGLKLDEVDDPRLPDPTDEVAAAIGPLPPTP